MPRDFDAAAREISARHFAELREMVERQQSTRPAHDEREAEIRRNAERKLAIRLALARDARFLAKRKPTVYRPSPSTSNNEEE